MHRHHHPSIQFITRFVHSGRIDQNDLAFGPRDDTLNLKARSLWLVRNGGDIFANQPIQKSRFAGVGTSDERNVTGAECGLRLSHSLSA